MNPVVKTFQFGDQTVTLETGRIARQASGAVLVTMGDIVVLATVVGVKTATTDQDFFPLSVFYQEKTYAAGKIPGGFLKRESRPTEKEILTSRLIDRPIRPLFPKEFMHEVQVVCTVMSTDKQHDPDIVAMIATSAALAISGIPLHGTIGAARVGFNEEQGYLLNPSFEVLKTSELNMVVAGTNDAILMIESQAQELTEDEILGAVLFAHQEYQSTIQAIIELANSVGKELWEWKAPVDDVALKNQVSAFAEKMRAAYQVTAVKQERQTTLNILRQEMLTDLTSKEGEFESADVKRSCRKFEKSIVREHILNSMTHIDGRDSKTVRDIEVAVGFLKKAHGSSLFTRGETQAIVVATLGTTRDAQLIESLEGVRKDTFMLHYNFSSSSVGECGRIAAPGRRELGHGCLARRSIQAVLPTQEEFPYTIRVVSEITESDGSSSMAAVCGASLALMDAGVPLKAPVAGVAIGLVKEGEQFVVLTDILDDEDHLGDMDFKVAGTSKGITAVQMDIKIPGINENIIELALEQAMHARLYILGEMNTVISNARTELNPNAPISMSLKINPDKIRDVIGKGGSNIRSICDNTGASIDIDDSGLVQIFAEDRDKAQAAYDRVYTTTAAAEIGKIYTGEVTRILDFGAFVSILPGRDGLVHISQIVHERVDNVSNYLRIGQIVDVVVLNIDSRGRIKLSIKEVERTRKNQSG